MPHGFTVDGRGVYGCVYGTFDPATDALFMKAVGGPEPTGPFRIWELQTGSAIASWKDSGGITADQLMLDQATVLISDVGLPPKPLSLLDLRTGQREPLPWNTPAAASRPTLTVDGRYLVYSPDNPAPFAVCWWDRSERRVVGSFPGLVVSEVAANGRWLTVHRGDITRVCVREPAKDKIVAQIDVAEPFDWAWFSDDGGYLLIRAESGVQIVELPSGRVCASHLGGLRFFVLPDVQQVVAEEQANDGSWWFVRWDLVTGHVIGRRRPPSAFEPAFNFGNLATRYALYAGNADGGLSALIHKYLTAIPFLGKFLASDATCYLVYDHRTDQEVGRVIPRNPWIVELAPDGRTVINASFDGDLEFWNVPPRKPLTWFAAAASLAALPISFVAWRRTRRIRRSETAASA